MQIQDIRENSDRQFMDKNSTRDSVQFHRFGEHTVSASTPKEVEFDNFVDGGDKQFWEKVIKSAEHIESGVLPSKMDRTIEKSSFDLDFTQIGLDLRPETERNDQMNIDGTEIPKPRDVKRQPGRSIEQKD